MTKKDYEVIAWAFVDAQKRAENAGFDINVETYDHIVATVMEHLKRANPRFSPSIFLSYIVKGITS